MEHRTLDDIKRVADAVPLETTAPRMTRMERLERWAILLEQHRGGLEPLMRLEYLPAEERLLQRGDDTPLAVAFRDPALRAQGLAGDRVGDGMAYFELSDHEAHYLLCDCHYLGALTPTVIAGRVRDVAHRSALRECWDVARSALIRWR